MNFASRRSNVRAVNGMVSTTQPLAAVAGLRMLMEGGNAVDAAVGAAATLNVVEPHSTGVGGDLFALVWSADEKRVRALNASGRSSENASLEELVRAGLRVVPDQSPYAVTVPGAVSGWESLLERYGRMGLSDVLAPAIGYAEGGFPVSEVISDHWKAGASRLRAGPAGGELLLNGEAAQNRARVMRIPTLGRTLRAIAEGGGEAFYKGADGGAHIEVHAVDGGLAVRARLCEPPLGVGGACERVVSRVRLLAVSAAFAGGERADGAQHLRGVRSCRNGGSERGLLSSSDRGDEAVVRGLLGVRLRPGSDVGFRRRSAVERVRGGAAVFDHVGPRSGHRIAGQAAGASRHGVRERG